MRARKSCGAGQHPPLTAALDKCPITGTSPPTSIVSPPSAARRVSIHADRRPDACWSLAREKTLKPRAAPSGNEDFTPSRTMLRPSTAALAERLVGPGPSTGEAPIPLFRSRSRALLRSFRRRRDETDRPLEAMLARTLSVGHHSKLCDRPLPVRVLDHRREEPLQLCADHGPGEPRLVLGE